MRGRRHCAAAIVVAAAIAGCGGEVRQIRPFKDGPIEHAAMPEQGDAPAKAAPEAPRAPEAPTPAGRIASGECDGEALGVVTTPYVYGAETESRAELARRAMKMGGDAVIDVKRVTSGTDESLLGTAVRCHSLREARPYDVVARIDIPGIEGGPAAAFAELRARAWEAQADLVVDVHVTEDDADHAHVTGVAIKYR